MERFRALCVSMLLVCSLVVMSDPPSTITVVTEPEKPLQYEEDGTVKGAATMVVREIFRRAKLEPDIRVLPWARAYREASQQPNVGIYSIAKIPQRDAAFTWIGPILPYKWQVFRLQSRADIKLSTLEDLKRYKVGVVLGDASHQYLLAKGFENLPSGNLSTAATASHVLNKLHAGRVDLMPMSELNCQYPINHCRHFERVLELPEMGSGLYLAFNLYSDQALVERLDKAFRSMEEDGSLKTLQATLPQRY